MTADERRPASNQDLFATRATHLQVICYDVVFYRLFSKGFDLCSSDRQTLVSFVYLLLSLEMAYNVMAVDNAKKPIKTKVMDAKAIFVTILCA